ncbi:hypothetical protein V8E36_009091 [Tilletia maclaganii]
MNSARIFFKVLGTYCRCAMVLAAATMLAIGVPLVVLLVWAALTDLRRSIVTHNALLDHKISVCLHDFVRYRCEDPVKAVWEACRAVQSCLVIPNPDYKTFSLSVAAIDLKMKALEAFGLIPTTTFLTMLVAAAGFLAYP